VDGFEAREEKQKHMFVMAGLEPANHQEIQIARRHAFPSLALRDGWPAQGRP
jgi:hypothetical protein